METDNETAWMTRSINLGYDFAKECRTLCDENPSNLPKPLEDIILSMMTELWDFRFSQTEIRHALQSAIDGLPRYAAGEERRS